STLTLAPTLARPTVTKGTGATVTLGAKPTRHASAIITTRGVLYAPTASNANPALGGPGVTEVDDAVSSTGVFSESVSGLTPATGYSFVAFATNSVGTTYSSPVTTFTTANLAPMVTSP